MDRVDGATATIGITDYAQQQLGDVVYRRAAGRRPHDHSGRVFGTIESVKAVSELFAPVTGEVVAVNDALKHSLNPSTSDPHERLDDQGASRRTPARSARCWTPPPTRRS